MKSNLTKKFILAILLLVPISFYGQTDKRNGELKGIILDKNTKQSLPGAAILLNGTTIGTSSDENGKFKITNLNEGIYSITVSFIGYQNKIINDIQILRNKANYLEIEIEEALILMKDVTVSAYRYENNRMTPISNYSFSREEISRNPGAQGDIFRAIGMLPGVSSSGGQFSAIAVRGQGTRDNVYMVDEIPITELGHLDGARDGFTDPNGARFSIFAPRVIDNAEFQGGGISAQYGRRSSSYLGLNIKEGNKFDYALDGQIDLLGITCNYDGPSYFNNNTSLFVSYRYQNFGKVMKMVGIDYMGLPAYSDFIFKSTTEINKKNKLSIIAIYSPETMYKDTNNIKKDKELNDLFITGETPSKGSISVVGLNLRSVTSTKSYWKNVVYYTNKSVRGNIGKVLLTTDINGKLIQSSKIGIEKDFKKINYSESKIGYRSIFNYCFNNSNKLTAGIDFDRVFITNERYLKSNDTLYIFSGNDFIPNPSAHYSVVEPKYYNSNFNDFSYNISSYIDFSFLIFNSLTINAGLRYDYTGFSNQHTLAPRLSGSYQLNEKNSINFATGIFYQDPVYLDISDQPKNKKLKEEKIEHFILGYKKYFTPELKFTIESWYKNFDNMVIRPISGSTEQNNDGNGWAAGVDFNLTKRLSKKVHGQIGYSYMQSKRNDNNGNGEYNFTFSQPHQVNFLLSYKAGDHWILATKFRYATGKPTDKYIIHSNIFNDINNVRYSMEIVGKNENRLSDFLSLDVRVDYIFKIRGVNLSAFVDIVDITNRMNPNQEFFNSINGKTFYDGLAIFPTFGIKFVY